MKKAISILLVLLLGLGLAGCGERTHYETDDYVLTLDITGKEDFRILQLGDIHLGNKDDRQRQYDYLDGVIGEAHADMIVLTGDIFTLADRTTAREFFAFLDSYSLPWTVTFGNHDEQCYFPVDWMTGYLNDFGSNCLFIDRQDDDVFGNSNFAIDLLKDGKEFAELILMDSNRYNYGEYIGYDYIKDDQIEWYGRIVDRATERNGGTPLDSLLFFHIPLPEWNDAWEAYERGEAELISGERYEGCSSPEYNSGLFDVILEKGSTRAISVSHDHSSDYILRYKGIYLCYGVNSSDRVYFTDGIIGGRVITLKSDRTLTFEDIFRAYGQEADK